MNAKRLIVSGFALAGLVVPGIAQAATVRVPIKDFYTYSLHQDPELSPSGRYLFLLAADARHSERNVLVVYDLKTHKRWRAIGFRAVYFRDEIFGTVHWVNDHRIITEPAVREVNRSSYVVGQILTVNVARRSVAMLQGPSQNTSTSYSVSYDVLDWLRHDPDHILTVAHYFRGIGSTALVPTSDLYNHPPRAYLVDVKNHAHPGVESTGVKASHLMVTS